ncbi:MAG: metallophosphoesterase [Candidatus Eisenbacteria bacterium]|nr:metallophosphoesterase [Candidatus Eisenbacteria bacterium]
MRERTTVVPARFLIGLLAAALAAGASLAQADPLASSDLPIGDTLTVIQRPLLNIPAIVTSGDTLRIECEADPAATGWSACLLRGSIEIPLPVLSASYDATTTWWTIETLVPQVPLHELYDLEVSASGGIHDRTEHAVRVIPAFRSDFYFVHITDTHLPTHLYYYQQGADTDTSEMADLHAVIDDIAIINPEFVLLTGDLVNEGELEDFLSKRYYTRAQEILARFAVPVYLTSGNHDIGGWNDTPPPAGTARRDWWRFFGWKRLNNPPAGAPARTQDYSFDYGPVRFTGLEAYLNYDSWRYEIYGSKSFTSAQMAWLADDLASASGSAARVLFYHRDFSGQINLNSLGAEMALWGHIHRDEGSVTQAPYNLSTNNACDGERAYRLVRFSNGALVPSPTVSAGSTGQNLRVAYWPANDGGADTVSALVVNNLNERFEHGLLRFLMPARAASYEADGGTLLQVDDTDSVAVCYVEVDIPAAGTTTVTVAAANSSDVAGGTETIPSRPRLAPGRPNPFNPSTTFSYQIGMDGAAKLALYDVRGREVAVLAEGRHRRGAHEASWDGLLPDGSRAPSGVYLALLSAQGEVLNRKVVLAR